MAESKVKKTGNFFKDSWAEILLVMQMIMGGEAGNDDGKEGAFSRFLKTKLHFVTREDEIKMAAFIAKNLTEEEKKKLDRFKRSLDDRGYDIGFMRVHFSNIIKEDSTAAKEIMSEILSLSRWESKKVVLGRYFLLQKKGFFLKLWENRGFVITLILFLLVLVWMEV